MRLLAVIMTTLAAPAAADDLCDELWFTRNLIFDRAGYCFGSTLGQSVFDNGNCTGQDVALSQAEKDFVDELRAMEADFNCSVDTGRRSLTFHGQNMRREIIQLPTPSEFESACIGWLAAPENLLAGRWDEAAVVGQILPGDNVAFSHNPVGEWEFVQVYRDSTLIDEGWYRWGFTSDGRCSAMAG